MTRVQFQLFPNVFLLLGYKMGRKNAKLADQKLFSVSALGYKRDWLWIKNAKTGAKEGASFDRLDYQTLDAALKMGNKGAVVPN